MADKTECLGGRQVKVRPDGWSECTACDHHGNCYDLSKARLGLTTALDART